MTARAGVREGVARLFAELMAGPSTLAELTAASGLAESTVRCWIISFRSEGLVRISGYEAIRSGQNVKPIYSLNPEGLQDYRRPKANKASQRAARYRMRQRLRAQGVEPARIEMIVRSAHPIARS